MRKSQRNALLRLFRFILLAVVIFVIVDYCSPTFSANKTKSSARTHEKDPRSKKETIPEPTSKKDKEKKVLHEAFASTLERDLKTFQRQQLLQAPTMAPAVFPRADRLRNRELILRMEDVFAHIGNYLLEGTVIHDELALEQMYDDVFGKSVNNIYHDVLVADFMEFIIRDFYFVDIIETNLLPNFDRVYQRLAKTLTLMDRHHDSMSRRRRFVLFIMWDLRSKFNSDMEMASKARLEKLRQWMYRARTELIVKRKNKKNHENAESGGQLQHQQRKQSEIPLLHSVPNVGISFANIRSVQRKAGSASAAGTASSSGHVNTVAKHDRPTILVGIRFPRLEPHAPMTIAHFTKQTDMMASSTKKKKRQPPPEPGQRTVAQLVNGFLDFLDGEFHTNCNECTAHALEGVAVELFEDHYDSELMTYFIDFMMEAIIEQDPSPDSKKHVKQFVKGLLKRVADKYEHKRSFATYLVYILLESLISYDESQEDNVSKLASRIGKIKAYLDLRKLLHMGDDNDDNDDDDLIDLDEDDKKGNNDTVIETSRPELMMGNESMRVRKNEIITMVRRPSARKKEKKKEEAKNHTVHDKRMKESETDGLLLDRDE